MGSKYTRPEWRGRSKLFVPKTRAAVRKDLASVAASLFNNIDAINCLPGNEADPRQRASAAVMEELVNYRTDRGSGKASFPWFLVSMGARQDAVLTGVCLTKQYWLQEFSKGPEETVIEDDEDGNQVEKTREVHKLEIDRPDMALIPPENYVISPSALWTNPAQSAPFLIIKWPTDVACFEAVTAGVPDVTMTSTLSPTNSAANSAKRSSRPSLQRYSIATLRPSIQPSSRSRCARETTHSLPAERVFGPKKPIVGSLPGLRL